MRCNGFGILLFELLFVMEENEECVICHQFNDQMLMLQCVHDPCINCAAAHYAQEFKGKLKNYVRLVSCSIIHASSVGREHSWTSAA